MKKGFYPRVGGAVVLVIISIVLQILCSCITAVFMVMNLDPLYIMYIIFALSLVSVLIPAIIGIIKSGDPIKSYFAFMHSSPKTIFFAAFLTVGTHLVIKGLSGLITIFMPMNNSMTSLPILQGLNSWFGTLYILVIGPIIEEILFRGAILRGFLKNYSILRASLFSALLFGIVHLNPVQSVTAAIVGLSIALIFMKTGSLWACIFAHSLNNLLAIASFKTAYFFNVQQLQPIYLIPAFLIIAGAILSCAGLMVLWPLPNKITHILSISEEKPQKPDADAKPAARLRAPARFSHSIPGIISFITSLVCISGAALLFMSMTVSVSSGAALTSFYGIGFLIIFVLSLAGLGFGVWGAVKKGKKKFFPILGVVLNSILALCFTILLILQVVLYYMLNNFDVKL